MENYDFTKIDNLFVLLNSKSHFIIIKDEKDWPSRALNWTKGGWNRKIQIFVNDEKCFSIDGGKWKGSTTASYSTKGKVYDNKIDIHFSKITIKYLQDIIRKTNNL